MKRLFLLIAPWLLAACASTGGPTQPAGEATAPAGEPAAPSGLSIPVEYYRLDNGLRVVLSRDTAIPTVTVGVYYHIGFRIEPRDRTGFAHLFEHMMFQGSANLGKMEFIRLVQGNGGVLNGSTRFDYTNYYQIVPAHTLETILWAEADRMRGLDITQDNLTNQQGVVKNEVKVNVLNRPYGGFPWLTLPQYANTNWYNAHNFYGDLEDLDAATLEDVQSFFDTYYTPSNAVLVLAGDFETAAARDWIERYFGSIPGREPVALPDISEPRQEAERRHAYTDALAPRPGLAVGWHVPERGTDEHFAFGLLDQILLQGEDSALWQKLVQQRGYSDSVGGGINLLGNMFNYDGPMLWTVSLIHDNAVPADQIVADIDAEIARLAEGPPSQDVLDRALTKLRADLYGVAGSSTRFGLVDLLASFALFDDNPALVNSLESRFRAVPPELISTVAREYLRPGNRTILELQPAESAEGEQP
ncbi:MAG: insulinase family protein [Steroidobacteraceae bacterium]